MVDSVAVENDVLDDLADYSFGNKDNLALFLKVDFGTFKDTGQTYANIVLVPHWDFVGSFLPMKFPISYEQARSLRVPHLSLVKFDVDMVGMFEVRQMISNVRFVKSVQPRLFNELFYFDNQQQFTINSKGRGYGLVGIFVTSASGVLQNGNVWANAVLFPPLSQTQNVFSPVKYSLDSEDAKTFSSYPVPSLVHYYHAPSQKVKKSKPLLFTPDLIRPITREELISFYT